MLQAVIRRGELDRVITFIKGVRSRGNANQDKYDSWTLIDGYHTVYARKREMVGKELVVADQIKFMQNTEFVVAKHDTVTVENRIVFDSKVYEIISITELGMQRNSYTQIIASYIDNASYSLQGAFAVNPYSGSFDTP